VQQQSTIAYYQGVQRLLGTAVTDRFLRLFLLPGVAHCGGGAGPAQIDVLSALMGWTERGQAPEMLLASKTATQRSAIPGDVGQAQPGSGPVYPLAPPAQSALFSRPVFPFPAIARYDGSGDPNALASYHAEVSAGAVPQVLNSRSEQLIGPDNQADYRVIGGRLVANGTRRRR
jgi:Tannase and feruloyl esterase